MFKKIRRDLYRIWFNVTGGKEKNNYIKEIERLRKKVTGLQEMVGDPCHVVENVLDGDISWYKYEALKKDGRHGYWQNAQAIINNETYRNEINHTYSDLIQEIAKNSTDFDHVMRLRMTLNGVKLLANRMEDISDTSIDVPVKSPFREI